MFFSADPDNKLPIFADRLVSNARFCRDDHPEHFELRAEVMKFLKRCEERGPLVGYKAGAVPSTDYDFARFNEGHDVQHNQAPFWAIPITSIPVPKPAQVLLTEEELGICLLYTSPSPRDA